MFVCCGPQIHLEIRNRAVRESNRFRTGQKQADTKASASASASKTWPGIVFWPRGCMLCAPVSEPTVPSPPSSLGVFFYNRYATATRSTSERPSSWPRPGRTPAQWCPATETCNTMWYPSTCAAMGLAYVRAGTQMIVPPPPPVIQCGTRVLVSL